MSPARPSFTDTQGQYLAFIDAYMRVHGRPPAEAAMQRHFQVSPPSVYQMVLTTAGSRPQYRSADEPRTLAPPTLTQSVNPLRTGTSCERVLWES